MFLIIGVHPDLIAARESVHERHTFKPTHIFNHGICDWEQKLFFGKSLIEIVEVNTNLDLSILPSDKDDVGKLVRMLLFPDEFRIYELLEI